MIHRLKLITIGVVIILGLGACVSYDFEGNASVGDTMITVSGESLEGDKVNIPGDFSGQSTLLLFGYVQDSQFDIDRWLIGLDMTKTQVAVYEIPTIKEMAPRMFSTFINDGMRKGIPKALWKGVVTIYDDGEKVQRFTGNKNPNNARVMLINESGVIQYFYDKGFSVEALNSVRDALNQNE